MEMVKEEPVDNDQNMDEDSWRSITVKEEPVDNDQNMDEDSWRSITVKSELNTFETAAEGLDNSEEEELKPLAAVFIKPEEEIEKIAEEQQDPLAVSEDVGSHTVKIKKTRDRVFHPDRRAVITLAATTIILAAVALLKRHQRRRRTARVKPWVRK